MRVAVIGTGSVGRTLAPAFRSIGHDVVVGTRDPEETRRREEWQTLDLPLTTSADAVAGADLVVNATSGTSSLEALAGLGLDGTVLLDVANPLDFSAGFPPSLSVSNTDSLAEQIQRAHPGCAVVKALNTVTAAVMVDPGRLAEPTTMFVASDDADGRALVRGLLSELGWADVVELPGLDAARAWRCGSPCGSG